MSVKPKPPAPYKRRENMTIAHGPSINPDRCIKSKCKESFCNNIATYNSLYCSIECEDWDRQLKLHKIEQVKQEFKRAAEVVKALPKWMQELGERNV